MAREQERSTAKLKNKEFACLGNTKCPDEISKCHDNLTTGIFQDMVCRSK